jgi:hypothetical protein
MVEGSIIWDEGNTKRYEQRDVSLYVFLEISILKRNKQPISTF